MDTQLPRPAHPGAPALHTACASMRISWLGPPGALVTLRASQDPGIWSGGGAFRDLARYLRGYIYGESDAEAALSIKVIYRVMLKRVIYAGE